MRAEKEQLEFTGTLFMAARRLGIYARLEGEDFRWWDTATHWSWVVPAKSDKKSTLEAAAESLENYLNGQKV